MQIVKRLRFCAFNRGQNLDFAPFRIGQDPFDHMLFADRFDHFACFRTVGDANAGIEDAQVVVDFGHRADSAARIACMGFLFDGNGRGEPFDMATFGFGICLTNWRA